MRWETPGNLGGVVSAMLPRFELLFSRGPSSRHTSRIQPHPVTLVGRSSSLPRAAASSSFSVGSLLSSTEVDDARTRTTPRHDRAVKWRTRAVCLSIRDALLRAAEIPIQTRESRSRRTKLYIKNAHWPSLSPARIQSGAVFFVLRSFSLSLSLSFVARCAPIFHVSLSLSFRFFHHSLLPFAFYAARKLHRSQSPQSKTRLSAFDHISAQRTTLVTVLWRAPLSSLLTS